MPQKDARRFVVKMREDRRFRDMALATADPQALACFLQAEGLFFDQRELVGAMAECMAELELSGRQVAPE